MPAKAGIQYFLVGTPKCSKRSHNREWDFNPGSSTVLPGFRHSKDKLDARFRGHDGAVCSIGNYWTDVIPTHAGSIPRMPCGRRTSTDCRSETFRQAIRLPIMKH